jgi:predicted nucleotidyltransferase component of viral defense system
VDRNSEYYKQVQLLTSVLPLVAQETCFALKGGTAINLFVRDFPRLSVDIDLVYLPMDDRDTALANITAALNRIADSILEAISGTQIQKSFESRADALRLIVTQGDVQIKIELSPVLRGSVFPEEMRAVSEKVEEQFGYVEMQMLSIADLYAGKLCAALDRQHPRDLFDVKFLLENEGLTDDLRKTFLVYLISHNRTMGELLRPTRKDLQAVYENEFVRMAQVNLPLEELEAVRERLISDLNASLTDDERRFLLSFKSLNPDWSLLGLPGVELLPAVRWKMINLGKMDKDRHAQALKNLEDILFGG